MAGLAKFLEGGAFGILNDILSTFHSEDGYAIPNRFDVVIVPPGAGSSNSRKVSMRCETVTIPGRNLNTLTDGNPYGPTREIVQGYSYADVTAVFQCSSDMKEKRFFETWQRLAYNPQTWAMQYYNDYSGSIKLFQLDETDRQRYGVELVECFPKTIEAQAVDYSTVNAIQTVSVTFSYRYWKDLIDEADLPRPLGDRIADSILDTVESKITSMIPKVLRKL